VVLTLFNDVKTLQRPRLKVSSLFLDIKAAFDNVDNSTLARILREGGIPRYLVFWVSSFLGELSCTLVFQGAPGTPAPVNIWAPQGSPISPLLFLLYVSPLHCKVPRGLMMSYIDGFALTAASPSYRGNIRSLQKPFENQEPKALRIGVSFSVAKTELIPWRTPSQRNSPRCLSPFRSKESCFGPPTCLGGSGTGSRLLLIPPPTSRADWPSPRVPLPSSDALAPPGRA